VSGGFGDLVRYARQQSGLTQEQLAVAVDLSAKGLAKIERDEVSPSLKNFQKIVQALKIPQSALAALMEEGSDAERRTRESKIAVVVGQLTGVGQDLALQQISALLPHFRRTS
jgi:transcriptional regulator with XRE-family HTH domain